MRYADDLVVGFEHRKEAERFLKELGNGWANFGLELHPGQNAADGVWALCRGESESPWRRETRRHSAFLGFAHRCGTGRLRRFVIWRQSERKRLEAKLQEVKQTLRARMHEPVAQVGEWLSRLLRGYYNYHGVPGNRASLNRFRERVMGYWWHALKRRSQRGRLTVRPDEASGRALHSATGNTGILIRKYALTPNIRARSRMR
ncbi:MAG: hypothetical protein U5J83_13650 [Bryobacterales bacterium]|nr:hypothetical protein [Bryobacterales bacterium]